MNNNNGTRLITFVSFLVVLTAQAGAQQQHDEHDSAMSAPSAKTMPTMGDDAWEFHGLEFAPPLPEGMTLDETLDAAAAGPPDTWPEPVHDNPTLSFTLLEQMEYRRSDDQGDQFGWDVQGWIGNDDHKFWWKSEGEVSLEGPSAGEAEFQALYAAPLSAFWFAQAGVRYDYVRSPGNTQNRASLVLGVQGLAPYRFELEPTLFITDDGDVLARLTASYDIYVTQRLVLQPRTEIDLAAQDVPEYGLGAGVNNLTLELRLRYEFKREFAPYVGVRYFTLVGETADIGRRNGEAVDDLQIVFGIRLAF